MNEQRKDILEMLAQGKITPEEAEQLIAALERDLPPAAASSEARPKGRPKYLRLMVDTNENGEPGRVNARVPLHLLRAGVQLAALINGRTAATRRRHVSWRRAGRPRGSPRRAGQPEPPAARA